MKFEKYIKESSLSRIWMKNEKYECAGISAFRPEYTHKENQQRSKKLKAQLHTYGYSTTSLKGVYEGGKEISYFITNDMESDDFFKRIIKLGEEYDQDSVLLIPKNAISNTGEKAYLYGTNKIGDVGWHKKVVFNKGKLGTNSPFYTSFVGSRPFIFEEVGLTTNKRMFDGKGIWAMKTIANEDWNNIDI